MSTRLEIASRSDRLSARTSGLTTSQAPILFSCGAFQRAPDIVPRNLLGNLSQRVLHRRCQDVVLMERLLYAGAHIHAILHKTDELRFWLSRCKSKDLIVRPDALALVCQAPEGTQRQKPLLVLAKPAHDFAGAAGRLCSLAAWWRKLLRP